MNPHSRYGQWARPLKKHARSFEQQRYWSVHGGYNPLIAQPKPPKGPEVPPLGDFEFSCEGLRCRQSRRFSLQLSETIQHRRRSIRVMMDHPPPLTLASVDICDAVLVGY